MLKNGKSANRNEHQNRKTEVFRRKNRKTELKNSQNHRTENPNAPSLNTSEFENLSCHHNKQWLTDMKNSWFFAFVQSLPIYHVEGFSIYQEMKTTLNWRRLSFPFYFRSKHHPPPLWIFTIWLRYYGILAIGVYIYITNSNGSSYRELRTKDQKLGKTLFIASSIYTEYI